MGGIFGGGKPGGPPGGGQPPRPQAGGRIKLGGFSWGYVFILAFAGLVMFTILQLNEMNLQPDVLLAKSQLAVANAQEYAAKTPIIQQMPSVLWSGGVFLAIALGAGALFITVVVGATSFGLGVLDRFIAHGPSLEHVDADGRKTTLVIQHLNPPAQKMSGPQFGPGRQQTMLPNNRPQALSEGKRIKPEERRAPGKNPREQHGIPEGAIPVMLPGEDPVNASQDDPLAALDTTMPI